MTTSQISWDHVTRSRGKVSWGDWPSGQLQQDPIEGPWRGCGHSCRAEQVAWVGEGGSLSQAGSIPPPYSPLSLQPLLPNRAGLSPHNCS